MQVNRRLWLLSSLGSLLWWPLLPAHALQIEGVALDPSVRLGDATLQRNGAGVRRFLIFKVYVAALYLQQPLRSTQQVLDDTGPKLLRLVMLRQIPASELVEKMQTGIANNVDPQQQQQLQPAFDRLRQRLQQAGDLRPGQVLELAWLPGQGTLIRLDGQPLGAAEPDLALYTALLRVWLGERPADNALKLALLGH